MKLGFWQGLGRLGTGAKTVRWYRAGKSPAPVAAYQAKGAKSYLASLVNLANPSTYNLTTTAAPTWDAINGWRGNGSSMFLETGILPSSGWSIIVKYSGAPAAEARLFGEEVTNAGMSIVPRWTNELMYFVNGGQVAGAALSGAVSAVVAVAGQNGYKDGVLLTSSVPVWTTTTNRTILILARKGGSGAYEFFSGAIQAIAIYNTVLTLEQVQAVGEAMNAISTATENSVTVDSSQLVRTHAGSDWYGRPTAEVANGVVALVYIKRSSHTAQDGELHIKFSSNYGTTWSDEDKTLLGAAVTNFPMNPPSLGASQDAQEPWMMTAPNNDLLLHMWKANYNVSTSGTWQSRSINGGEAWGIPAQVLPTGLANPERMFATDDHFVYDGVIYAGARFFDADWQHGKNILIKSDDNGATWDYVSDITSTSNNTSEVGIEYLGNNRIIAVCRGFTDTFVWIVFSNDMGATWGTPVGAPIALSGRHRISTKTHLQGGANWWEDSTLIMWGFVLGRRSCIWISEDSGAHWSEAHYVDTQTDDAGYGDVFYNPNTGQYVFISYYGVFDFADIKQYNLSIGGI